MALLKLCRVKLYFTNIDHVCCRHRKYNIPRYTKIVMIKTRSTLNCQKINVWVGNETAIKKLEQW